MRPDRAGRDRAAPGSRWASAARRSVECADRRARAVWRIRSRADAPAALARTVWRIRSRTHPPTRINAARIGGSGRERTHCLALAYALLASGVGRPAEFGRDRTRRLALARDCLAK